MSDYIEYDDIGVTAIKCMECDLPVADRTIVNVKGKDVLSMKRLPNWRQPMKVAIVTKAGIKGFIEPIVCSECEGQDLANQEIIDKVNRAAVLESQFYNQPIENISFIQLDVGA